MDGSYIFLESKFLCPRPMCHFLYNSAVLDTAVLHFSVTISVVNVLSLITNYCLSAFVQVPQLPTAHQARVEVV